MQLRRRLGDLVARDPSRLCDLAELRLEDATDHAPGKDEADIVTTTRIDEQQSIDHHIEPRLFLRLARGGTMRRLAAFDPAAGEHPSRAEVGRADDEEPALVIGGKDVRAFDATISAPEETGELDRPTDQQPRD